VRTSCVACLTQWFSLPPSSELASVNATLRSLFSCVAQWWFSVPTPSEHMCPSTQHPGLFPVGRLVSGLEAEPLRGADHQEVRSVRWLTCRKQDRGCRRGCGPVSQDAVRKTNHSEEREREREQKWETEKQNDPRDLLRFFFSLFFPHKRQFSTAKAKFHQDFASSPFETPTFAKRLPGNLTQLRTHRQWCLPGPFLEEERCTSRW
jgi:hypothetical protein